MSILSLSPSRVTAFLELKTLTSRGIRWKHNPRVTSQSRLLDRHLKLTGRAGAGSARATRDQLDSQDKGSDRPPAPQFSPAVFSFLFCLRWSYLQLCLHCRLPLLSLGEKRDEETVGLWGRRKSQMAIDSFSHHQRHNRIASLLQFKHWQLCKKETPICKYILSIYLL